MKNLEELFNKEEMIEANSWFSSDEVLSNPRIALYNVMKDVQKLYEFKSVALTDEVVEYAINHGLTPSGDFRKNREVMKNYKLAYYLISLDSNLFEDVDLDIVTPELLDLALDNGYDLNKNERVFKNQNFLKVLIEKDSKYLNLVKAEYITPELIELACKNKFVFEFDGKRAKRELTNTGLDLDDYIEDENNLHLLKYDELVISSFTNGYEEIIFDEEINPNNKYYDYMISKALTDKISLNNLKNKKLYDNEIFRKYINDNLFKSDNSRELMNKYLNDNYIKGNLELVSYILSDEFVEAFGLLQVDMIMKYIICPEEKFKIDVLLNIVNEKELKNILDKLINKDGELNILQMLKIVNYLASNISLVEKINTLSEDEINDLRFLIYENNEELKIDNKEDLKSINNIRYEYYNNLDLSVKEKLLLYLTGSSLEEFDDMQREKITSLRYKKLLIESNINLEERSNIISYLEYLENLNSLYNEELNLVWNNLEKYDVKHILMSDIKTSFKNDYINYYKKNLTDVKKQKEDYFVDDIPVIEYNGEDFSFFIHVFNGVESRTSKPFSVASMYENTIGRSYISTSYINQNHYKGTSTKEKEGIFIFGDFSKENFITSENEDNLILGKENNSLNVSVELGAYLNNLEMACLTKSFNEFSFYRVNNNDYKPLPSAILCYNEITEFDKNTALKYQIPIVLIKTMAYENLNEELFSKYYLEVTNGDVTNLDKLLGLGFKLNKNFSIEQIKEFFKYVPSEQYMFLLDSLLLYGYDQKLINELLNNNYINNEVELENRKSK